MPIDSLGVIGKIRELKRKCKKLKDDIASDRPLSETVVSISAVYGLTSALDLSQITLSREETIEQISKLITQLEEHEKSIIAKKQQELDAATKKKQEEELEQVVQESTRVLETMRSAQVSYLKEIQDQYLQLQKKYAEFRDKQLQLYKCNARIGVLNASIVKQVKELSATLNEALVQACRKRGITPPDGLKPEDLLLDSIIEFRKANPDPAKPVEDLQEGIYKIFEVRGLEYFSSKKSEALLADQKDTLREIFDNIKEKNPELFNTIQKLYDEEQLSRTLTPQVQEFERQYMQDINAWYRLRGRDLSGLVEKYEVDRELETRLEAVDSEVTAAEKKEQELKQSNPEVPDSGHKTDEEIEKLTNEIEEAVPGAIEALSVKLRKINGNLKINEDLEGKIGEYIDLINKPNYSEELREKELEKLYGDFATTNMIELAKLDPAQRDQVKTAFKDSLKTISLKMKKIDLLKKMQQAEQKVKELRGKQEQLKTQSQNMSNPDPEKVKPPLSFSTPSRIAGVLGCGVGRIKDALIKTLREMKSAIEKQDAISFVQSDVSKVSAYADIREKVEGHLFVPPDLDLTSKESLMRSSYTSLAAMLGIEAANQKESTVKKLVKDKLIIAGVEKDNVDGFMSQLASFVQMRLLLNMTDGIKLSELDDKCFDKQLRLLEEREKEYKAMAQKGVRPASAIMDGGDPKTRRDELEQHALKIRDGLYAHVMPSGEPFYALDVCSKENIAEVVNRLKHSHEITWHYIPQEHKKAAELETLRNWKRAIFDDGKGPVMTKLSELMPDCPGAWAKWFGNIDNNYKRLKWLKNEKIKTELKTELLRDVIGNDEKLLNEMWLDVSRTGNQGLIDEVYGLLTKEQKGILGKSYEAQKGEFELRKLLLENGGLRFYKEARDAIKELKEKSKEQHTALKTVEADLAREQEHLKKLQEDIKLPSADTVVLQQQIDAGTKKISELESGKKKYTAAIDGYRTKVDEKEAELRMLVDDKLPNHVTPAQIKQLEKLEILEGGTINYGSSIEVELARLRAQEEISRRGGTKLEEVAIATRIESRMKKREEEIQKLLTKLEDGMSPEEQEIIMDELKTRREELKLFKNKLGSEYQDYARGEISEERRIIENLEDDVLRLIDSLENLDLGEERSRVIAELVDKRGDLKDLKQGEGEDLEEEVEESNSVMP